MIANKVVLGELQNAWKGVQTKFAGADAGLLTSYALGNVFAPMMADEPYNLVLVDAFAVLNDVLIALRNDGKFKCKGRNLWPLMNASKQSLPWVNFQLVKEGKNCRDDIAHHSKIIPRIKCWKYLDAIEDELITWHIVPASARSNFSDPGTEQK